MLMTESLPALPSDLLAGASLYLDFDGTLVEIAERPDAVVVDGALTDLVTAVAMRLDGRVALISGRSIAALGALLAAPSIAISGSHGVETRWPDGRNDIPSTPSGLSDAVAALRDWAAERPGLLVEEKPFGVALHYRALPQAAEECRAFAAELSQSSGLGLQTGKMVVELRAAGTDKGDALRRLHAEPPFAGHRPVFVGDDDTDEPAFRAAVALGGAGVLVGPMRETAASYRVPNVAAVRAWLENAA